MCKGEHRRADIVGMVMAQVSLKAALKKWGTLFRLGGQIEFGILYIHTQLKTTVYVGITTKKYPNQAKKRPSHARSSRALPLPPPTSLQ